MKRPDREAKDELDYHVLSRAERELILKRLVENEDDTAIRLVYADLLDDEGEHEEADRQRQWSAAKQWLVRFSKSFSYEELMEFGHRAVNETNSSQKTAVDEAMWADLKAHSQEFWDNWSVVTGVPLPRSLDNKEFETWECCSHEVYYWFGPPLDGQQDFSEEDLANLKVELEKVVASLSETLRDFFERRKTQRLTEISRDLQVTRQTLLEWTEEIRNQFRAAGLEKHFR
jgi:uncharacterized protein (TIGR02996 family)